MKKYIYPLLVLLTMSGCSKAVKYRINAYHNNLPEPDGKGSIVYGYFISNYPLKEVTIVKMNDGRRFRADLVPSTVFKWKNRNYFYIANVPKGKYAIQKIVSSSISGRYYVYQYATFRYGSKFRFDVPANGSVYLGSIGMLKTSAYQIMKDKYPLSAIYGEKSDQGKILLVFAKVSEEEYKKQQALAVSMMAGKKPNSGWIPIIRKQFKDHNQSMKKDSK